MKKTVAGKHQVCGRFSGCLLHNLDEVCKVENHAFKNRTSKITCRVARRQTMPRARQIWVQIRRALAVQNRNEDWRITRSPGVFQRAENLPAPIQHISSIAAGASQQIRAVVCSTAKS